jgi:hypothetical protein
MIKVSIGTDVASVELETDAPYSPDVLDDLARQARLSLATAAGEVDLDGSDVEGPTDPDDEA